MTDANQEGKRLLENAESLFAQDKFKESGEWFGRIASMRGFEAEGHFGRGLSLLNLREFDSANAEFMLALRFNPKHSGTFYELGEVAENKKQVDSAITWYKTALGVDPAFQPALERLRALLPAESGELALLEAGIAESLSEIAAAGTAESPAVSPRNPVSVGSMIVLGILPFIASIATCAWFQLFAIQHLRADQIVDEYSLGLNLRRIFLGIMILIVGAIGSLLFVRSQIKRSG